MALNDQLHLLTVLLSEVSRSFYLSLRILPAEVRPAIGVAYLLARAADTVADRASLPRLKRLDHLLLFRRQLTDSVQPAEVAAVSQFVVSGATEDSTDAPIAPSAEQRLLALLSECFELYQSLDPADRSRVSEVVVSLTRAMEIDLRQFVAGKEPEALDSFDALEDYTYHAAGCVGPFWTRMCMARLPAFGGWKADRMEALGIRFGKALQWTNILRDVPRDLERGRCYLPREDLSQEGLQPGELRNPEIWPRLQPLYRRYIRHALDHYGAAWEYTLAIPRSCLRVRWACIWPLWIGLETLTLLLRPDANPLRSSPRIRIPRSRVYAIMLRSVMTAWSDPLITAHQERLVNGLLGR
jgi:farnesyl-diphosphate farnesyltransferase